MARTFATSSTSCAFIHTRPVMFRQCLWGAIVLLAVVTIGCGRHDNAIVADARAHIAATPALRDTTISIIVKRGVVLLRGHVAATSQTTQAAAVVARVDGVRRVISQLTLSDDSIRDAVERALQEDGLLSDVQVDVHVVDGVVRLTSNATNATQRMQALAVVRALPGVVGVEDNMK